MPTRRSVLTQGWIVASILYGILRTVLVWRFLSDYGVHPIVFAVVELVSSALYGWASARLVIAVIDHDRTKRRSMALVTLIGYIAPDLYVFASADRFPDDLLVTVLAIAVVSALLTAFGLVRSVRTLR